MHTVVLDSLEEYLSGALTPTERQTIEGHLSTCQECREEIREMQDVSQLFVSLRADEVTEPSPGFFAAIMRQVAVRPAPSFASLFSLDFAFGRRVVFASLLTLAVLGSYLVTREVQVPAGLSPDAVMAEQNQPEFDSAPAHNNMLVTLTAYEQH